MSCDLRRRPGQPDSMMVIRVPAPALSRHRPARRSLDCSDGGGALKYPPIFRADVGTRVHDRPFQCTARGCASEPWLVAPTAHTSVADRAATALK